MKRPSFAIELLRRIVTFALVAPLVLPLWPLYLLLRAVLGRPPVVPATPRLLHIARLALTAHPTPDVEATSRVVVLCIVAQRALTIPFVGLAWFLDELIYGRALDRVTITEPIFEVS